MCGICIIVYKRKDLIATEDQNEIKLETDYKHEESYSKLLSNRGPDAKGYHDEILNNSLDGNINIGIDFQGHVLHLRGHLTSQPLKDKAGNVLLWNGEIFGGAIKVSSEQNDSEELLKALSSLKTDCGIEKICQEILNIFGGIHGPWAFIYWQKQLNQLWFGRDYLGRRSLLWHLPQSPTGKFVLTSVGFKSAEMNFTEVPTKMIYCIQGKDLEHFWSMQDDSSTRNGANFEACITSYPIGLSKLGYIDKTFLRNSELCECSLGEDMNYMEIDTIKRGYKNAEKLFPSEQKISDKDPNDVGHLRIEFSNRPLVAQASNVTEEVTDCSSSSPDNISTVNMAINGKDQLEMASNSANGGNGSRECLIDVEVSNEIRYDSERTIRTCYCKEAMFNTDPPRSDTNMNSKLLEHYAKHFMHVLEQATRRRVFNLPREEVHHGQYKESIADKEMDGTHNGAKVGILFSGGIDSMVLAAMADRYVPEGETIDLMNVAFEQQTGCKHQKFRHKISKQKEHNESSYEVPDRITGKAGIKELNQKRKWNFIEVNVTLDEVRNARSKRVRHLVYPLDSVLDDSIGCAIWFAARGTGSQYVLENGELVKKAEVYTSKAKVLLTGMGADEQLGGYARHRSKFEKFGWKGLQEEMEMEMKRISSRNLGRDDRCISDHGREARFPFLDEKVVCFLEKVPLWIKCDPRLPRGYGEKRLLREVARKLNLHGSAILPKRAIQFGSKIAKLENSKEKGNDSCARLKDHEEKKQDILL